MAKDNLDTLICDYNTMAKEYGFPVRDKAFSSYKQAYEALEILEKKVIARVRARDEERTRLLGECVWATGWDGALCFTLTELEQGRAIALRRVMNNAKEARNKWLEEFDKDPLYALSGAAGITELSAKAKIAKSILTTFEKQSEHNAPMSFTEWCRTARRIKIEELMLNVQRGESTSHFSNAIDGATRSAIASMCSSWGELGWAEEVEDETGNR